MVQRSKTITAASILAAAIGLAACADDSGACLVGADCASGQCNAAGACVEPSGTTGTTSADTGRDDSSAGGSSDGADDESGAGTGTGESGDGEADCMPPNGDLLIERTELFFDPGLQANYLAAQDVTFDTAGALIDSQRVWDLSVDFPGDHTSSGEFLPVQGQWFAPAFPGATHATRLTDAADLLGVFETTDSALVLRGVVSPTDGATRTEVVYDPPATILSFPLFESQTWQSESTVSGVASGVAVVYTERYENSIDASGTVITPFGSYTALRVGVVLTRTVGIVPTVIRSFAFVSECAGTIASVRSTDNERSTEFTQVSEVRRLDP